MSRNADEITQRALMAYQASLQWVEMAKTPDQTVKALETLARCERELENALRGLPVNPEWDALVLAIRERSNQ